MTPSRSTNSSSITYKESLAIVPSAYPTSPYLSKYDLNNINSNMKTMNYNINSKIKTNLKASLLWFRNLHIQVLRQTSMKKDSQRYHPNSQTMKTASKNLASKTQRSSPCPSRSKNLQIQVPIQTSMKNNSHKIRPNYQLIKPALPNWALPTSIKLIQKWITWIDTQHKNWYKNWWYQSWIIELHQSEILSSKFTQLSFFFRPSFSWYQ